MRCPCENGQFLYFDSCPGEVYSLWVLFGFPKRGAEGAYSIKY